MEAKQVKFYAQGTAGGTFDLYMRTLIPYLEKQTGHTFIPINEPSAGGRTAIANVIKDLDNSIALVSGEGILTDEIYNPNPLFRIADLPIIGRLSYDEKAILSRKYSSLYQLGKADNIIFGGTGPGDGNSDIAAIWLYSTKLKGKVVHGYKGAAGLNLALENGEIDARFATIESAIGIPTINIIYPEYDSPVLMWRKRISLMGRLLIGHPRYVEVMSNIRKTDDFAAELFDKKLLLNWATRDRILIESVELKLHTPSNIKDIVNN